jgi:predicted permease
MTMRYYLPGARYDSVDARQRKVEDIVRRVEALPGVEAASSSVLIPLSGGGGFDRVVVEGRDVAKGEEPRFQWTAVAGHWFETLGVPIVSGRTMTEAELRDTIPVAVVNRTMAKQLWPDADALGRRFRRASDTTKTWFTVVGIAADFRNNGPSEQKEQPSAAYVPYRFFSPRNHGLIVRVRGEPSGIVSAVRSQIRAADASVPVFRVQTMEEARLESFWEFGLFGSMFSAFGGIALLLAAIGIYGVISFGVAQRTQEIGVRVALGAQHRHVLGMVVGQGVRLTAIGVGVGLVGAYGITRVLSSLFWGVSPSDPLSFAGVAIFLTLVAAVASYLPARRATAVDPIIALRSE